MGGYRVLIGGAAAVLAVGGAVSLGGARGAPAVPSRASGSAAVTALAPASTRDDGWRGDIDTLATQLPAREAGGTVSASPADFAAAAAALKASVPTATDDQLVAGVLRLVASLGVAHASADVSGRSDGFPLVLSQFPDGFHVIGAATDLKPLLGDRLTAVGGTPVDTVVRDVSALVSHENAAWLSARLPDLLVNATVLRGLGILGAGRGDFAFQDPAGKPVTQNLTAVPWKEWENTAWAADARAALPLSAQNPAAPFWFRYLADSRTVYVRYRVCTDAPGFATLTQQVFDTTSHNPVDRIVVDLRGNGGGNSQVLAPFLSALQSSKFATPRTLYALIDRGTFSSAVINAIQLADLAHATLAGEPTGGKPNSYGEVQSFQLPYSGITVYYATRFFQQLPGDPPSLDPAIPVVTSFAQYAAGDDPVLDAALRGSG